MHTLKNAYVNIRSLGCDKLFGVCWIENMILNDTVNNFHSRETSLIRL